MSFFFFFSFSFLLPLNNSVWVQLLDRKQQKLELVLLSVDNFSEPPTSVYNTKSSSASVQVLYTEQSTVWVNVNDLLYFLPSDEPTEVKFLWGSEESEFRHLYLITSSITGIDKNTILLDLST